MYMAKNHNLRIILFSVLVIGLLGGMLVYISIEGQPKPIATAEAVTDILESKEYIVYDLTEDFREEWEAGDRLQYALCSQIENLTFKYFIFDTESTAENVRKQYLGIIKEEKYTLDSVKSSEGASNYVIYTLKSKGIYTILMRVGNTLVYADCDEEIDYEINSILVDMGYLD